MLERGKGTWVQRRFNEVVTFLFPTESGLYKAKVVVKVCLLGKEGAVSTSS